MTKNNQQNGYTIIETMISISLFLVIVTIGMTALLNANLLHQKSQNMRSITDNLSFIMEDMSRNLRTGTNYYCITGGDSVPSAGATKSGPSCWGVAFQAVDPSGVNGVTEWAYEAVSQTNGSSTTYYIRRSTNGGATWVQLTPDEVVITNTLSPFAVLGAEPPPGDLQQPLVGIRLVGNINLKSVSTPFSLQTSVSQRLVDI